MSEERVRRIDRDGYCEVVFDRPEAHNAVTAAMWERLTAILDPMVAGPPGLLLLRGSRWNPFTAGSDVKEWTTLPLTAVDQSFGAMEHAIGLLGAISCPVLAAVDGYALGGGFELCLAADLRIGTERARFGMPIARFGIMLSPAIAKRLVEVLGPARSLDLLYTGRLLEGKEALELGIVSYLATPEQLQSRTEALIRQILAQSPASLRAAKRSVGLCLPSAPPPQAGELPYFIEPVEFESRVAKFLGRERGEGGRQE